METFRKEVLKLEEKLINENSDIIVSEKKQNKNKKKQFSGRYLKKITPIRQVFFILWLQ